MKKGNRGLLKNSFENRSYTIMTAQELDVSFDVMFFLNALRGDLFSVSINCSYNNYITSH